ncbi:MAG: NAD-dependent succinate-semialdehyde dehydrogenase [Fidelibacterota bacterium]
MSELISINPVTGEIIKTYRGLSSREVSTILEALQETFKEWRQLSIRERSSYFFRAAEILRNNADEYGRLMALEMGKPLAQGKAEAEKCAWVCEYYAENGVAFLKPQPVATDASESFISFQPVGIVLAVMPWNFPFWQVFRFAAPALIAGNVGVLKHASNVQGCARAIEGVFKEAGFPENVFRNLTIPASNVSKVVEHPLVQAVTLTGSTPAGKAVAGKAGACLKKTVMELGGSDPYVVLKDADLDQALEACVTGRLLNTGQSCIAAKRFIIEKPILAEFTDRLSTRMKIVKTGNPLDPDVDLGPMVNATARNELHRQVQASIENGAECILGGEIPEGPGAFYPATILSKVTPGMAAFDEELFGPVAVVIAAENETEALTLANQTAFGLGASVFTTDIAKGRRIAEQYLEAGACFVNDFVRSDPRLPFGGIKSSGYGRELSSYGILEFVNIKTVYIR